MPLVSLFRDAITADLSHWQHLLAYVLPPAAANTLWLLLGVGCVVALVGTGSAWLVTAYDFPGRRILVWALLLPLAVPTYITAFAWLDLLHPIGPLQTTLRDLLGIENPRAFRLPDLRSLGGAIFVLGFVLYPYVYLSMRAAFLSQSANLIEAARTLGAGPFTVFHRVVLPLSRPALAIGISLALLETLNDIGASEFLGVQTLTVSIYTTWVTRGDLAGAAQIALFMLIIVFSLILLERYGRRYQRYTDRHRLRSVRPITLRGSRALIALIVGSIPVLSGFILPAGHLLTETVKRLQSSGGLSPQLPAQLYNTLLLAGSVTLLTLAAGICLGWAGRIRRSGHHVNPGRICARIASMGYAIPGTVLAIGLLAPFSCLDQLFTSSHTAGLMISGSIIALIIGCSLRFLAIAIGSVEAGLTQIPPSFEQAARSLGTNTKHTFIRVHLPLLRPALISGALLVFVDAMKELPITLLLRPLNFETLATWLYAEASRGTYEEGAIAALMIVLSGLIPVTLLSRMTLDRNKRF